MGSRHEGQGRAHRTNVCTHPQLDAKVIAAQAQAGHEHHDGGDDEDRDARIVCVIVVLQRAHTNGQVAVAGKGMERTWTSRVTRMCVGVDKQQSPAAARISIQRQKPVCVAGGMYSDQMQAASRRL